MPIHARSLSDKLLRRSKSKARLQDEFKVEEAAIPPPPVPQVLPAFKLDSSLDLPSTFSLRPQPTASTSQSGLSPGKQHRRSKSFSELLTAVANPDQPWRSREVWLALHAKKKDSERGREGLGAEPNVLERGYGWRDASISQNGRARLWINELKEEAEGVIITGRSSDSRTSRPAGQSISGADIGAGATWEQEGTSGAKATSPPTALPTSQSHPGYSYATSLYRLKSEKGYSSSSHSQPNLATQARNGAQTPRINRTPSGSSAASSLSPLTPSSMSARSAPSSGRQGTRPLFLRDSSTTSASSSYHDADTDSIGLPLPPLLPGIIKRSDSPGGFGDMATPIPWARQSPSKKLPITSLSLSGSDSQRRHTRQRSMTAPSTWTSPYALVTPPPPHDTSLLPSPLIVPLTRDLPITQIGPDARAEIPSRDLVGGIIELDLGEGTTNAGGTERPKRAGIRPSVCAGRTAMSRPIRQDSDGSSDARSGSSRRGQGGLAAAERGGWI